MTDEGAHEMKKSFVMTGYVQRSTCNCGCVSNNAFWQDGGFGGSTHLSHLHREIAKFLDELSGAGEGKNGEAHDVKVTVTIQSLGPHEHRVVSRRSFSGLGLEDNEDLKKLINRPEGTPDLVVLAGADQFGSEAERKEALVSAERTLSVAFLQDVHDRLLLVQRTGDLSKLGGLMESLASTITGRR